MQSKACIPEDALTALQRIDAATVDPPALGDMLVRALDALLPIFDCDRAWLIRPGRPDGGDAQIVAERAKPGWSCAEESDPTAPADDAVRALVDACLESDAPVRFDAGSNPLSAAETEAFRARQVRSQLAMALRPKGDEPCVLAIQHCSGAFLYEQAVPLFHAIGTRLAETIGTELELRGLRQSEERFRTLVEHAPEAITMIDVDTRLYVDANPQAEALHRLPREALVGKLGPADLSPEIQLDGRPSAEAAPDYLNRALAGEFPKFEWIHVTPDGEETLCEVSLARLPDPDRKLVRASISDITERKAAEFERAELEAKLAQSQKMETVGQLTGGVAHDFNNILTVVAGNLELAADYVDRNSEAESLIGRALEAAWRGATLTERLLAFSRKQALVPQVVNANDLAKGMRDLLRRTLEETVELKIVGEPDLWMCEADPVQLESAILNLAINARDAMSGGGQLTISTGNAALDDKKAAGRPDLQPGDYVVVAVSDTGIGIPSKAVEKVFEPFYTTKEVGRGSGLGLSMVYGFAQQSGGRAIIRSREGKGTTVEIYLPRASMAAEKPREADRSEVRGSRGETILVVEDDPDVRILSVAMLSRLGYRVLEASEASAALSLLEHSPEVKLLFTDVVLPGRMRGPELADEARQRRPGLAVLYTSGYAESAIVHKDRRDDGIELLHKPFLQKELATKIRAAIDGAKG